jgi:hypothetical protein
MVTQCLGERLRKSTIYGERNRSTLDSKATVLLTGATGYVGGRLLKVLEGRGLRVRCLARRPEALRAGIAP